MEEEPAPAAADVEQTFARMQAELAADVVQLLELRRVDGVGVGVEIRARIHHPLVEPDPVERVGDVVVMRDVAAVAAVLMQE
jgi:hypothetical protein